MEIVTSWMERGLERGLEQGRQEGLEHERKLLLRMLRKRLGDLDPGVDQQIGRLPADRLEQLGEDLLDFNSAVDLEVWLQPTC